MKNRLFLFLAAAAVLFAGCEKAITPSEGCFTVSKTKQVKFAPSNLRVSYSVNPQTGEKTYIYSFAPNQWDALGSGSTGPDNPFDLFGWGTGNEPEKSVTGDSAYVSFVDWGNNIIIDAHGMPTSGWRTLTYEEWNYVVNERPNAARLRCAATIDGIPGMLLLPDTWSLGEVRHYFTSSYTDTVFTTSDPYNDDWQKFEAAGAVFLPAGGVRDGNSRNGYRTYGRYWSSTENIFNEAFFMGFMSPGEYSTGLRHLGYSVRLVRDEQPL